MELLSELTLLIMFACVAFCFITGSIYAVHTVWGTWRIKRSFIGGPLSGKIIKLPRIQDYFIHISGEHTYTYVRMGRNFKYMQHATKEFE